MREGCASDPDAYPISAKAAARARLCARMSAIEVSYGAHPTNGRMRASCFARQPKASLAAPPVTETADTRPRRALPAAFDALCRRTTKGASWDAAHHHRRIETG